VKGYFLIKDNKHWGMSFESLTFEFNFFIFEFVCVVLSLSNFRK